MENEQAQKIEKTEETGKKEELEKVHEDLTKDKTCPFRGEKCRGRHEKCKLYWEVSFSKYYEKADIDEKGNPKEGAKKKLLVLGDCQFSWMAKLLYDQVGSFEEMKSILLKPLSKSKPGILVPNGGIGISQGGS